jgi:hypothetical protein
MRAMLDSWGMIFGGAIALALLVVSVPIAIVRLLEAAEASAGWVLEQLHRATERAARAARSPAAERRGPVATRRLPTSRT